MFPIFFILCYSGVLFDVFLRPKIYSLRAALAHNSVFLCLYICPSWYEWGLIMTRLGFRGGIS